MRLAICFSLAAWVLLGLACYTAIHSYDSAMEKRHYSATITSPIHDHYYNGANCMVLAKGANDAPVYHVGRC